MGRTKDFCDFDEEQFDDIDTILENDGQTCDVFRPANMTSATGFSAEAGALTLIERILVKISRKKEVTTVASNGMKIMRVTFTGITDSNNVRIGDLWRTADKEYRVTGYDTASLGKLEVKLEMTE